MRAHVHVAIAYIMKSSFFQSVGFPHEGIAWGNRALLVSTGKNQVTKKSTKLKNLSCSGD
jgi:hypothetical protein